MWLETSSERSPRAQTSLMWITESQNHREPWLEGTPKGHQAQLWQPLWCRKASAGWSWLWAAVVAVLRKALLCTGPCQRPGTKSITRWKLMDLSLTWCWISDSTVCLAFTCLVPDWHLLACIFSNIILILSLLRYFNTSHCWCIWVVFLKYIFPCTVCITYLMSEACVRLSMFANVRGFIPELNQMLPRQHSADINKT